MKKKSVDEIAEAKINQAYSYAAEKATGVKPMIDQAKKPTTKKTAAKKPAAKKSVAKKSCK